MLNDYIDSFSNHFILLFLSGWSDHHRKTWYALPNMVIKYTLHRLYWRRVWARQKSTKINHGCNFEYNAIFCQLPAWNQSSFHVRSPPSYEFASIVHAWVQYHQDLSEKFINLASKLLVTPLKHGIHLLIF